jgi:catechol 2,3-dioxygenase-like lactoylglutathione lyase family enzyme
MQAYGLMWVGTRTPEFEATRRFFETLLGLPVGNEREHFVRFDLPDAGSVEVFDARADPYTHFTTGPVVGIQVSDFDRALAELASSGYPLLGEVGGEPGDYRWQHFRGPDGVVLEIVDYPNRPSPGAPAGPLQITRLAFMGLATSKFEETGRFYQDVLQAKTVDEEENVIECHLPDGSAVEAFRRGSDMDHPHLRTGPLPGFGVKDYSAAIAVLREHGVPILQTREGKWGGWAHFRAPDGCVYEITDRLEDQRPPRSV